MGVQASVARTTTSARTVPPRVSTDGRVSATRARMSRTSVCSKTLHPASLDRVGQSTGQERRLQRRAVRA